MREGGREIVEEDTQHDPKQQVFSHDILPQMKGTIAFLTSCVFLEGNFT